ncbi:hypothetical protein WJX72_012038 [[Myrmecia] bisecta]|uniref:Uncharacterized protein n=1 Tax=[Myrmecia] bisecta TaxID=41462 RepID=A0AAW1PQ16_9CHLO
MAEFKGVSEKFRLSLVSDDGYSTERVVVQMGLDGVFILSSDGSRTLRKYPLNHISRWALRGDSLVLYTKTPVDVEERTVTLKADETTIRSVLDTLTCSCMQMVELLNSKEPTGDNQQTTNSLTNLIKGGQNKSSLPTVDEVEFWREPEKAGWLQSQGEHIKNWRRRWFVLKQGFLFRFASADVTFSTKPRGVVDLSKVTDVSEGREATGRPLSLKLSTATGAVCYIADSETEQVEWMSALEGAVAKIVRQVAGVEDEPPAASARSSGAGSDPSWAKQMEKSYAASQKHSKSSSRSTHPSSPTDDRNTMVKIVGYDSGAPAQPAARTSRHTDDFAYGSLGYGSIAGVAGVANSSAGSQGSHPASVIKVDYPAYPALVPTPSSSSQGVYPSLSSAGSYGGYSQSYQPLAQDQLPPAQVPAQQQASFSGYGGAPQDNGSYGGYGGGGYQAQEVQQQAAPLSNISAAGWQVHYTAEGQAYYHHTATGTTTWEPPASLV